MGVAFKISWRNIWRHKGKSLVIGVILLLGSLLMTIGNGMITGMEKGMSDNIMDLFTGDVIIIPNEQEKNDVLFGSMSGKPLKVIKNYDNIKKVLQQEGMIAQYLPVTAGMVLVLNSGGEMGSIMLLGVDIERYREVFPKSIKVTEGKLFKSTDRGLLVPEEARKMAYDYMDFWLLPEGVKLDPAKLIKEAKENMDNLDVRTEVIIMGSSDSNTSMDIKVPVKGIITYKALNKIWGSYCIVDIESFREAHNFVTGADAEVKISKVQKEILNNDNLDQFFSSGNLIDNTGVSGESISIQDLKAETKREEKKYDVDAGSYNLVFLKIKKDVNPQIVIRKLNEVFKNKKLNVRAVSWKDAVGVIGSMAIMIKGALNLFIMFIFFVAIIVIMNTLSMAALERVPEIGMMRAIGARKGFLRKMYIYETGMLSFFFGGLGIIIGIIIIYLLKAANFTTTNEFLQLVYGGDKLNPIFTFADLVIGVFELIIVTVLSVLYPLRVVSKIAPLDAISRE